MSVNRKYEIQRNENNFFDLKKPARPSILIKFLFVCLSVTFFPINSDICITQLKDSYSVHELPTANKHIIHTKDGHSVHL